MAGDWYTHRRYIKDHTVQGIWEAHIKGEIAPGNVVDDVDVRAAGVLAEKGY
jgi:hypothetical protein